MMTRGGQKAQAGTYWNIMTGERMDLAQGGVLPGGGGDRYLKSPAFAAVAAGPLLGLVFAVFLPFIGIAMAVGLAARRVSQGLGDAAANSMSFGWSPMEAYLAGRKGKTGNRERDGDGASGRQ